MEVPFFLAADFANKSENGKLNVLGAFNVINAVNFPAIHRSLYLVIRLGLEYGEFDIEHEFRILLIDEDGNELGQQPGSIVVGKPEKGRRVFSDIIMEIRDLQLEKPGSYEFRFIINKETKGIASIDVVRVQSKDAE